MANDLRSVRCFVRRLGGYRVKQGHKSPEIAKTKRQKASKRRASSPTARQSLPVASTETEFARLSRERDEALQEQAATSKVPSIIRRSPANTQPVFEAIVDSAASWKGFDIFIGFNDIYFMPLMFLISGNFVLSSIERRGRRAFVRERFLRLFGTLINRSRKSAIDPSSAALFRQCQRNR